MPLGVVNIVRFPTPSSNDEIVPPDQGLWDQSALVNQEWRDAIVDENETGMWEQPNLANQKWQDAIVDENEAGVWDRIPSSEAEWTDAPQKDEEEEKRQDGMVLIPKIAEGLYYPLIPLIGYGFLGLSLFDHINIIYPIKINEPIWIVDTLGQISERIPILWIGFLLVFFGGRAMCGDGK